MRNILHRLICWYLRRWCGGAFHCFSYGPQGRYVALMNDPTYHEFAKIYPGSNPSDPRPLKPGWRSGVMEGGE